MMTFLQWLEQAGDATMMWSGKDGYDQGLQSDVGLAYRSPIVPVKKSRLSEKLEKLFGKKKSGTDPRAPSSA
jgi:hypothetical protein